MARFLVWEVFCDGLVVGEVGVFFGDFVDQRFVWLCFDCGFEWVIECLVIDVEFFDFFVV